MVRKGQGCCGILASKVHPVTKGFTAYLETQRRNNGKGAPFERR